MFKDERRCKVWEQIRQHDLRAFADRLTPDLFCEAAFCKARRKMPLDFWTARRKATAEPSGKENGREAKTAGRPRRGW